MRYKELWNFRRVTRTGGILLSGTILAACIQEREVVVQPESTYISIQVNQGLQKRTRAEAGIQPGDQQDLIVQTLRVLAFGRNGGTVASNVLHTVVNGEGDVIEHPISTGDYDFVFIANEPAGAESDLGNIDYKADLHSLSFPETAFSSDEPIPMLQTIENVTVTNEAKARLNEGTRNIHGNPGNYAPGDVPDILTLELDRMAARVEIILKSQSDLTERFTGITLSNIPDRVPLFASLYTGAPIQRGGMRAYDPEQFADVVEGVAWGKKISRIILPSNNLTDNPGNPAMAVVLTVNIADLYNPSRELRIETGNYSLPYNSWLDVSGNVRQPLELSIAASDWEESLVNSWESPPIRMLNLSAVEASVTDYERARIYFWSNMLHVGVLRDLYVGESGDTTLETDQVFNDLAATDSNPSPGRLVYDPASGQGYMDLVINSITPSGITTYRLFLAAGTENGENQLIREIRVTVTRTGQEINAQ